MKIALLIVLMTATCCVAQNPGPSITGAIATSSSGTTNHARQFNGTSDYLVSASSLSLTGLTTSTIALEFRAYWNAWGTNDLLAFESSTNSNSNPGAFIVDMNSSAYSGNIQYAVRETSGFLICTIAQPSAAAWHSYLLFWNISSNSCAAYVDGSSVTATVQATGTAGGFFTSQTLYVMSRAGSSLFGAGRMSEMAILNGTPTSTDASVFAACGRPQIPGGSMPYYWPINQTSPEVATTGGINLNVNGTTNVASPCTF
jgi:hypothetical protein